MLSVRTVSLHSRQECFSFWIRGAGDSHTAETTLQVRALTVLCDGTHLYLSPGNAEAGLWQVQGCPELCSKLKTNLRETFAVSKAKKLKRKGFWEIILVAFLNSVSTLPHVARATKA